jgi:thiol:disulfide interchange protein DsbD
MTSAVIAPPAFRAARLACAAVLAVVAAVAPAARAQTAGAAIPAPDQLVRIAADPVTVAAGGSAEAVVRLTIAPTWHINANPARPDYMIPTEVTLAPAAGLRPGRPVYPAPHLARLEFDESEIAVYDGTVTVRVPVSADAGAAGGASELKGTLLFQACNDQVCLAPAKLRFAVRVIVGGGAAGAVAADTAAPEPAAFDTAAAATTVAPAAAPPGGPAGVFDNAFVRELERGSWLAFLGLFLIGLSLNLTPCVYPMLGVTVSIFGARQAAPALQVAGLAVVYVLGIAVMYTSLGLAAAFTGGLFGGLLQNPAVLVVLGLLFVALALSMFGLYELQLPPSLLAKLGGNTATGIAGTFLSGLLVGVFAAPCIGPPIVALLALVGAKGDPWFGFRTFFALSIGLGAPYLVLGTFSNLLQRLPRSGEWMVWVKKVFGVVMLALGLFYALLAIAPALAPFVAPAALLIGGAYLGFVEKSANRRRGFRVFKLVSGTLAVAGGIAVALAASREKVVFEPFSDAALQAALSGGRPVMLDFTADWCAPCHELENITFADFRVRDAARKFRTFRIDLTKYDSPEAEAWRRRFRITGVPTVLFLAPDGSEIVPARVEGFLAPKPFLQRMELGAAG